MRSLIFGTCYIGDDGAQRYKSRLIELWAKVVTHLNPECDVLLIDSASREAPEKFLAPLGFGYPEMIGDEIHPPSPRRDRQEKMVFSFRDNIGHLNLTGRDGWGRAFCKGIELSIINEYDWCAHIDGDVICAAPVIPVFEKLAKANVQVACPWDITYAFAATEVLFFRPEFMKRTRFVERYDWPNKTTEMFQNFMNPERLCEQMWGEDLFILPMRGLRDDFNRVSVNNIETSFPYGLDFITHITDFNVYLRFLEMKGIKL